ncbi:Alpha/Beta hydrolase protein [Apodospora peruviana]|uniref:Alpha/Beta hydrolase protein n=1 Tax=Apodospora peruviana TaxID=516989 RepID=A0AAE0IJL2_9PEZI|nr:Alpha/Beta hydrolase protein [Apodospora peruviana]
MATTEGEYVNFNAPGAGKPCKTWYKIVGHLESSSASPPLITLHGGPGAGHEYLAPLADLYHSRQIPVIFYDQIGCGRSTHLREKMGDRSFWTFDLFLKELDNLIDHLKLRDRGFYLLGQSWGGMLCGLYASRRPAGLRKAIIASGPASVPLYVQGCQGLLAELPPDVRETLEDCERRGDYESETYEKAASVFYGRHVCRIDPYPDELLAGFAHLKEDNTSYLTIQGPSEFIVTGSMKNWEGWHDAHNISAETLLLNGRYDEVTDLCMTPWFKHIPKVKWITLENSSHMAHFEERERYMQICGGFLTSDKGAATKSGIY